MNANVIPVAYAPTQQKPRRYVLWEKEGQKCHWCGKPTRHCAGDAWDQATVDHIIPRYKGGGSEEENLVSSCRLCNNRRSHEDARGLPEGSLLGKYDPDNGRTSPRPKHVALTGDDKKAIMAGQYGLVNGRPRKFSVEDVLREQRDQALREIGNLRTQNGVLKNQVDSLKHKLKTMTFRKLLLIKLIDLIRK